jgi:hypothetical protein
MRAPGSNQTLLSAVCRGGFRESKNFFNWACPMFDQLFDIGTVCQDGPSALPFSGSRYRFEFE